MIELIGIEKSFGTKKVLPSFSVSIPDHGFYLLRGENGCGKSTLISLLSLRDMDFWGDYVFDGVNVKRISKREREQLRQDKVSVILPRGNLISFLNVGENRKLFSDEPMNFDHLPDDGDVNHLSGGEELLLALSSELSRKDRRLVLLDEVTSALDDDHLSEVLSVLKETSKHCVVILATQDPRVLSLGTETHNLKCEEEFPIRISKVILD